MTFILGIETSTSVCSVSVSGDGRLLSLREISDARSHASQLTPFITEAIEEAGLSINDLSAIAVSKGPGSYTGLRIGVSTAKGIAYALNIPLIAVDTLLNMTSGFLEHYPEIENDGSSLLCPMIDARRMEVYSAIYDTKLKEIRGTKAEIINSGSFLSFLRENRVHFFGDGAEKCSSLITENKAVFHPDFRPSASSIGKNAFLRFQNKKFENLAYFEPFYLKDFVATTPVNKLF
jgi:tRNA threonylcarbamoyladenosine biosynthesis protein TsaB